VAIEERIATHQCAGIVHRHPIGDPGVIEGFLFLLVRAVIELDLID